MPRTGCLRVARRAPGALHGSLHAVLMRSVVASGPGLRCSVRCLAVVALLLASGARLPAQSLTVRAEGDTLHVSVRGLGLLEGDTLRHLQDGRSIRMDLQLTALGGRDGPALAAHRERFTVSYDLWEEQFAVTHLATPPRSISHLTRNEAEAWCLEQLSLPASSLAARGRDAPFRVRLAYRAVDAASGSERETGDGITLRGLIDFLSRRSTGDEAREGSVETGPLRLSVLMRPE